MDVQAINNDSEEILKDTPFGDFVLRKDPDGKVVVFSVDRFTGQERPVYIVSAEKGVLGFGNARHTFLQEWTRQAYQAQKEAQQLAIDSVEADLSRDFQRDFEKVMGRDGRWDDVQRLCRVPPAPEMKPKNRIHNAFVAASIAAMKRNERPRPSGG